MTAERVEVEARDGRAAEEDRIADALRGESAVPALERLSHLHDEAVETAQHANLLGRAPRAAILLAAGFVLVALAIPGADLVSLAVWGLFVGAAAFAVIRAYRQGIRAPFEIKKLRAFAADLHAILLYSGFAWGAGAFLALPADTGPVAVMAFSAGTAAILGVVLRERAATLSFLAPAILIPAAAAVLRPLPDGGSTALAVLMLAGLIAGLSLFLDWAETRRLSAPEFRRPNPA